MQINEINNLLDILLSSTDTSLRSIQTARCPHHFNLELVRLKDKKYVYKNSKYKTIHELFRIDNISDIRLNHDPVSYNGPIQTLIERGYIKPFIVFINNIAIDLDKVSIITDNNNHYLEIRDFSSIDFKLGGNYLTEIDGAVEIQLPKVPIELKDIMDLNISTITPDLITQVRLNGNVIDIKNTNVNPLYLNHEGTNILELECVKAKISTIEFKTNNYGKVAITDTACIKFQDTVKVVPLSNRNIDHLDIDFIFYGGLHYSKEEFRNIPFECIGQCVKPSMNFKEMNIFEGTTTNLLHLPLESEFKTYPETVFIFKDGYMDNIVENYGINIFKVNGSVSYKAFQFQSTEAVDNMTKFSKIEKAIEKLKNNELVDSINKIIEPFDFMYTWGIEPEERILEVVNTIVKYNSALLQPYIDSKSNIKQNTYTGIELKNICSIEEGNYTYRIRSKYKNFDRNIMIFINGELFDQDNITMDMGHLKCNFGSVIDDENIIDMLIFERVINNVAKVSIDINNKEVLACNYIPFLDLQILTHDIDFHIYNHIPRQEPLQYDISHYINKKEHGYVELDVDEYYYNKSLFLCSKRQFIHEKYVIAGNEMMVEDLYKILLPDTFRYCTNRYKFLVFHNKRKVNNSDAVICLNSPVLPFDKRFIHLNKKCEIGDVIDIYYVPDEMREVHTQEIMPDSGYIDLKRTDLGYNFDAKNSSIYVNGKRLSQNNVIPISNSTIRLNSDIYTTTNISVLRHIEYRDEVFELMESIEDVWSLMLKELSEEQRDDLFNIHTKITNTEIDIREGSYPKYQVLYEICRRYWLINEYKVKVENPIFYVREQADILCLPIDSSEFKDINILELFDQYGENKMTYINNDGSKCTPIDAEGLYFDYDKININHYMYIEPTDVTTPSLSNGQLEIGGKSIIDIISEHADSSMLFTYDGKQYLPIDASRIYEILTELNIGTEKVGSINASYIRPWFFDKLITIGDGIIRPIPIDMKIEQIVDLPPLYMEL